MYVDFVPSPDPAVRAVGMVGGRRGDHLVILHDSAHTVRELAPVALELLSVDELAALVDAMSLRELLSAVSARRLRAGPR